MTDFFLEIKSHCLVTLNEIEADDSNFSDVATLLEQTVKSLSQLEQNIASKTSKISKRYEVKEEQLAEKEILDIMNECRDQEKRLKSEASSIDKLRLDCEYVKDDLKWIVDTYPFRGFPEAFNKVQEVKRQLINLESVTHRFVIKLRFLFRPFEKWG